MTPLTRSRGYKQAHSCVPLLFASVPNVGRIATTREHHTSCVSVRAPGKAARTLIAPGLGPRAHRTQHIQSNAFHRRPCVRPRGRFAHTARTWRSRAPADPFPDWPTHRGSPVDVRGAEMGKTRHRAMRGTVEAKRGRGSELFGR